MADENILDSYDLDAHGMRVHIDVAQTEEFVPLYNLTFRGIGEATKLLIMSLREELLSMVPIDPSKIQDRIYINELDTKYIAASEILIDKYISCSDAEVKRLLIAYILNMMLGLGDLEAPLADDNLEEIAVNGSRDYIWVFHKKYQWCRTNIKPATDDLIYDQASQIGRVTGREITGLSPLMDAVLADGSRVNATLHPISQTGNTITIRKFSKNPWTMTALVKNHTLSAQLAAMIWMCIQNEISLMYSGGTASGKTSFLNASSIFFPANRRVISIEETRELTLPTFLQWIPMLARQPNPEGKGEITLYQLMINALRQRPDIVVVGEIRTQKDAETLFEAIHTGHAVYGTVHADNARDTIIRMINPPLNVPKVNMNALGAIVTLFRHRTRDIRRLLEFGEVLDSGDVSVLQRWNFKTDGFDTVADMTRLSEVLELYGGLSRKEIDDDLAEKVRVLQWMVKNDVIDVDNAGYVVANYYRDRAKVIGIVDSNAKFSKDIFI
jgi:flagellar protein FlaI